MKKKLVCISIVIGCIISLIIIFKVVSENQKKTNEREQQSEFKEEHETDLMYDDLISSNDKELSEDKLAESLSYFCDKNSDIDDDTTAFLLMKEAADLGNSDAQFFTGEMYLQGIGTSIDINCAAEYFRMAVHNNNIKAFSIYAKLCFVGYNDIYKNYIKYQDFEKAHELFVISEQTGDADSALALGIIYYYGMCVASDFNLANAYFSKAADSGCIMAEEWKQKVQVLVTQETMQIPNNNAKIPKEIIYKKNELNLLVEQYTDKIKQTEEYNEFDIEINNLKDLGPEASLYTVLYGKNDWLFYQNVNDGNTYNDYIGDPEKYFTIQEKENIIKNLEQQRAYIEQQKENCKFYVMIIPNKEAIYSEYMPSYINRISPKTRTDDLVEYIQKNSDIEIIYIKDAMIANKDMHQLYYYTDTHWNMKGTYIAVAELLKKYDKNLILDDKNFFANPELYAGDLGILLERQQRYKIDIVYNLNPNNIAESDKIDKSALLIGDSFGEFLSMEAEHFFKEGFVHKFIGEYNFDYSTAMNDILENQKFDIVIWECAERYIERLK